jgi:hypothetical protein
MKAREEMNGVEDGLSARLREYVLNPIVRVELAPPERSGGQTGAETDDDDGSVSF